MIPLSPRRTLLFSVALITLTALMTTGGCSASPEPKPTPTSLFASEEEAFAAAEEVYREYIAAFNEVNLQDPATFEAPAEYTDGRYEAGERKDLSELHAEGYVRSGDIVIVRITPERVDEDGAIYLRTCNDVSATALTDATGVLVTPEDRPAAFAIELRFEIRDGELLLVDSETVEDSSCAV